MARMIEWKSGGVTLKQKFLDPSKNQKFNFESEDDLECLLELIYGHYKCLEFWNAIKK